jgi:hypothetical protein
MAMSKTQRNLTTLALAWALTQLILSNVNAQPSYFEQGYAHNDYLHKKPLFEALGNGYTHLEADVFLLKDSLVIAHWFPYWKHKRTLESLYLAPLRQMFRNDGPHFNQPAITLVIDIKSSPRKTYLALRSLLEKYKDMLSSFEGGVYKQGMVNIVLTGNKPVDLISRETNRLVMLDDLLDRASQDHHDRLFAMASCKYSKVLQWTGKGRIPGKEKARLLNLVKIAHSQGKKARLWASPENENVWSELLNCGIDYINTDQLAKLKAFYDAHFAAFQVQSTGY